jgi:hypothetical protein
VRRLIALFALVALSGCAVLPTALDVQSGPELLVTTSQDFAYYSPAGPTMNASAQEIVSGFLAAGTGPQNDYSVAREFLSEEFAPRWQPAAQTLIRSGAPSFRESGQSILLVDVNVSARVDEHGRYADVSPAEGNSLRFQMVREAGQWRISAAPNLTVVTQPVFSVVFSAFPVYFVDSRSNFLVPDLRWFPSRASTPTKLVNALLAGPSEWLSTGVSTSIPADTRLTINAVSIEDGVAKVDFDANALAANNSARRVMLSQLRATLLQIPEINEVALSVNSSAQDIIPSSLRNVSAPGPTFVLTDNGIQRLSASDAQALSGTEAIMQDYNPTLFAIFDDAKRIAFASEQGVFLLERDGFRLQVGQLSQSTAVAALDFDSYGALWIFPRDAQEDIEVHDARGPIRYLSSDLQGTRLSSVLSPEGSRLVQAFALSDGQIILRAQTVTRDSTTAPIRLNEGIDIIPVVGKPLSLTWHGSNALRVLEETTSGLSALSEYPLSGPRRSLTMPPVIGTQLLSGSASISTYLLSDQGQLWALTGNTWRSNSSGAIALASLR